MWIPKEKWQGQEILDWVDIGTTRKDIWVSVPDTKGDTHVEQTDTTAIKHNPSAVLN